MDQYACANPFNVMRSTQIEKLFFSHPRHSRNAEPLRSIPSPTTDLPSTGYQQGNLVKFLPLTIHRPLQMSLNYAVHLLQSTTMNGDGHTANVSTKQRRRTRSQCSSGRLDPMHFQPVLEAQPELFDLTRNLKRNRCIKQPPCV